MNNNTAEVTNVEVSKVEQPHITSPEVYEFLITETRKDDVGNEYEYTRKEPVNVSALDSQIENLEAQLAVLKENKAKIVAIK